MQLTCDRTHAASERQTGRPSQPSGRSTPETVATVTGNSGRAGFGEGQRPGFCRDRTVHRRRNHSRCQRTTVSGWTNTKARRQSRHVWASPIQNSRSVERRCGRLLVRVRAASCCRRARFSRATARCPRQIRPMARRKTMSAVSMRDPVANERTDQPAWWADRDCGERQRRARVGEGGQAHLVARLSAAMPWHKMRNIVAKLPRLMHAKMKGLVQQVFHAPTHAAALKRGRDLIAKFKDRYPAAIECLERDLEECVTYLRFPDAHHQQIPTTNRLERLNGESRRRTKVIPRFPTKEDVAASGSRRIPTPSRFYRRIRT